jgi:nucleoside-diphosphate-sugar epimerase
MTRILVTGAAGFIGSHLSEALIERGDEVVGIDNFDPFYPREVKERNLSGLLPRSGFSFAEMDLLDGTGIKRLLTPDTVVVHLAAKAGVRPSLAAPLDYVRANLLGTQAVLDAVRAVGGTRIVFGSSSSVYGNDTPPPFREDAPAVGAISPYGATKRAGELILGALAPHARFRAAGLRFFTVYGPRQRPDLAIHAFAHRLAAGEAITLFGDGTESRDYTYIADIIAGVIAAVDWTASAPVGLELFNLGSRDPVPLKVMVDELAGAMGVEPKVEWSSRQPGDVLHTFADLSKSERMLGYRPRTRFPDGIRKFVAWFEETYARQ